MTDAIDDGIVVREAVMTTYEYLRASETLQPSELIYSVCREAAAPTPAHQALVGSVFLAFHEHLRGRHIGEVWMSPIDVVLDRERHLIVQPDLIVVSAPRLGIVTDRVWGAPDLAVEVLSPAPRIGSVDERLEWFAKYGVRECWLVHQTLREIEVIQFENGAIAGRRIFERHEPVRSIVLPEFARTLDDILA